MKVIKLCPPRTIEYSEDLTSISRRETKLDLALPMKVALKVKDPSKVESEE